MKITRGMLLRMIAGVLLTWLTIITIRILETITI